jgi:hypothetical protein
MKITRNDYNELKNAIKEYKEIHPDCIHMWKEDQRFNDTMLQWELFHRCNLQGRYKLYDYLNDDNIDTALKSIMREV